MAQQSLSASGSEGKSVSRVNSFTKFIRSPSRPKSMKKSTSGNPLTKLLFGSRKGSKKHLDDNEGEGSIGGAADEQENAQNVVEEEVKEVVETVIDNVIRRDDKQTSVEPETDVAGSTKSRDASSTDAVETKDRKHSLLDKFKEELETKETTHHFLDKLKEGLGEAKEGLKKNYDKAKEEVQTILHDKKQSVDIITSKETKPLLEEPASLAKNVQEEVVAAVSTIDDDLKKPETIRQEESREIVGEKKKEDGCVSTLAEGLQKMCAPWSSKKQV